MAQFSNFVPSEKEFEHLPPALQRKYFSSLERLRLAHDGASTNFVSRPQSARRPPPSRTINSRNQSFSVAATEPHRNFLTASTKQGRLRKIHKPSASQSSVQQQQQQQQQGLDFAALPPTLQRKLFSYEEQFQLTTSRSNPVILDAADEAIIRQHQRSYTVSRHELERDLDLLDSDDDDDDDAGEKEAKEGEKDDEMDAKDLESLRWLDEDQELDLKLDDYHAILAENASKYEASLPKRSYRRGASTSNISFRRRSSSSLSLRHPSQTSSSTMRTLPRRNDSPAQSHHYHHRNTESKDLGVPSTQPAAHYQDPEARMKLRVYLASPQKFDEALEFGFPAIHNASIPPPPPSTRPQTSAGPGEYHPKSFSIDDTPSLTEDDADERSDQFQQYSPRTPNDAGFPNHRMSEQSANERSHHLRPRIVKGYTDPYTHTVSADREMTLKMTLTRPDLRGANALDSSPSPHINNIPLERAPLTDPEAVRSIWDDLPEEPSRMKRLFKKFTRSS